MLWGRSKEGAAQAIAGDCSQEEWRNGEATVKTPQRKTNGAQEQNKKEMERYTNCIRVQQNLIVELQISKWNLCEENV
jgi:hypothetical protein